MTESVQKILILGGYGTFGRRLAQLLADDSRLTLVIAGRSLAKAQKLCAQLFSVGTVVPAELIGRAISSRSCGPSHPISSSMPAGRSRPMARIHIAWSKLRSRSAS